MESTIRGISVRAWLALITVGSGLAFLYIMAFVAIAALQGEIAMQIGLSIVVAVISFINLSLGYYLGQKNQPVTPPPTVDTVNNISDSTVTLPKPNPVGREPT